MRGKTIPVSALLPPGVGSRKQDTYSHDEEVQPAPGIGEELDEAIGCPLEQHLQDEDVGEDLVRVLQDGADGLPLLDVDVLEGLKERQRLPRVPTGKHATRRCQPRGSPPACGWPLISFLSLSRYPLLHVAFLKKPVFLRCNSHATPFSNFQYTVQELFTYSESYSCCQRRVVSITPQRNPAPSSLLGSPESWQPLSDFLSPATGLLLLDIS